MRGENDISRNPLGRMVQNEVQQAMERKAAQSAEVVKAPAGSDQQKPWLSVPEAAAELKVTRQRVWQMIRSGQLPARVFGCRYVISRVNVWRMKTAREALAKAKRHRMVSRRRPERERKKEA